MWAQASHTDFTTSEANTTEQVKEPDAVDDPIQVFAPAG